MATITITKAKVAKEDIEFGTGTVERTLSDGTTTTLNQVDAGDIPITDPSGQFDATTVEKALEELKGDIGQAHTDRWYYIDENDQLLHGLGDVINAPNDVEEETSWWMMSMNTVLHGMGDVIGR